jgi:outer membrane protein OmpA-like peptidoglycan-associated protein
MITGSMTRVGRVVVCGLAAMAVVFCISGAATAQSDSTPTWDIFAGYQYAHPGITVPLGDPNNPTTYKVPDMSKGFGTALTYNFDRHFGLEADFGYNGGSNNSLTTASIGPRFMWRSEDVNFFGHALLGGNWLSVGGINTGTTGLGAIIGGGLDLPITKSFAWRLFEADYVWGHHNYASLTTPQFPGLQRPSMDGVRLRTGIVFSWGGTEPVPPSASCTIQPSEVMVGEPLTANVSASNFNPKHTVTYSWSGNGGQVNGKDTTASIDTANATPGSYTVTAHVTDPQAKKNNEASCSANYTIKPLPPKNPPTMSLSANPTSVVTGGSVNLNASCNSPDNVPVSVANWTSNSGTVSGTGTSATLNTAGLPPGPVTVTAICTDSRGLTGQASTEVNVEKPPLPPVDKALEARLALHSVYFPTALPTEKEPSGGLVASQEKILSDLASDWQVYIKSKPDARLTLEGHADPRGGVKYNQGLSERRVARVKGFLVDHGVAESAIDTKALGDQHNLTPDEVKAEVEADQQLSKEERARIVRNMRTIILASNRRVDVTLNTGSGTTENSVRQFPFNAVDALTLIGGRTPVKKAAPATKKKAAPKKK